MASRDLAIGLIFLFQTAVGILGNSTFLCCAVLSDLAGNRVKPTDLILRNLAWANFMALLCKGVPQTMVAFGLDHSLDDVPCKLVFYFHRVARGISLGSTCLLSIFQAITISPSNSKWAQLKVRAPKVIRPSLCLCWVLHMVVNALIPINVMDIRDGRNLTGMRDFGYCAVRSPRRQFATLYSALLASTDILCLGLMMWASGSMVFVLSRHKKRVQHIHRYLPSRSAPESRATHSILTLVSSFLLSYLTSAILSTYMALLDEAMRWLVHTNVAMATCFPAFCPFLLLSHYTSGSRLYSGCCCQLTSCPGTVREL
ncbi:Vomeronasal type-1 receptor 4 [Sciurus carolinensis]|uniref:Vomeronasal type-1 receptor n=1 Tax=Sciurus carolinensis TaxID=30640 RepID=A0AA41SQ83_SCICA|nr:Vomeronasal type-1 receptor 4 [Sciurus carolinensis]